MCDVRGGEHCRAFGGRAFGRGRGVPGGGYAPGWGVGNVGLRHDNHCRTISRVMPTEIAALIDKPALLAIVLAVGAVIGVGVERIVEGWKRAERRGRGRKRQKERKNVV